MFIEYRPTALGSAVVYAWQAFYPPEEEYLYVGASYSVWMVPGFEDFHNV